jgi:hypothetical protein
MTAVSERDQCQIQTSVPSPPQESREIPAKARPNSDPEQSDAHQEQTSRQSDERRCEICLERVFRER